MKKLFGAIAATAIAASLALSTTVASADKYYTIPFDPAEWGTWMVGSPKLDETTDLAAEELPGGAGMKVWFPETATQQIPNFLLNFGSGIVEVQQGDDLHIDVTLDGEEGGMDIRWNVEIGFNGAGIDRMNIAKYIGQATGNEKLQANQYRQLPSGTYNVVLDVEDLIKAFDADNGTNNYDKVFNSGATNTRMLTTINFQMATNTPDKNSDKDYALTIRDFSLGTDGTFADAGTSTAPSSTAPSTSSSTGTSSKGSTTSSKPAATSSKGQVSTGESILPIVGIAALAVVATSAVVVTKKRAK